MSRKTPIQFDTFLKLNEVTAKDKLQNGEVWKAENIVFDKVFGKARARGDFRYRNDDALNPINTTDPIGSIIDVKDSAGQFWTLAGNGTRIEKTNWISGFTNCKTGLSSQPYFKHAQFGGGLIITNGLDAPFRLSGSGFGTSDPLEISAPDVREMHIQRIKNFSTQTAGFMWDDHIYRIDDFNTGDNFASYIFPDGGVGTYISGGNGTINSTGAIFRTPANGGVGVIPFNYSNGSTLADLETGGELTSFGNYRYLIVYKDDKGNISPPSNAVGTVQATEYKRAFLLYDIPVSSDSRVTSKIIFRTEGYVSGEGGEKGAIFYKVAEIPNDITQYEDRLADADLDLTVVPIFIRCPQKADHILLHNNRIFLANITVAKKFFIFPMQPVVPKGSDTTVVDPTGHNRIYEDTSLTSDFRASLVEFNNSYLVPASKWYKYLVTFVDSDGLESDPIYSAVVDADNGGFTGCRVTLSNIPLPILYSNSKKNPLIAKRRIYRSEGQESSTFSDETPAYYRLIVEQNTEDNDYGYGMSSTYLDNNAQPTSGDYVKETFIYPSAVVFSRGGRDATFYLEDIRQVDQNDPDEINGIRDDGSGVIFWKKNNIYKIYTGGIVNNWYLRRHYENIGCDEPKSIAIQGAVAYFMHNKKIYLMPQEGYPEEISMQIRPSLEAPSGSVSVISSEANNNWYVLLAQTSSTSQFIFVFDNQAGSWYKFPFTSRKLEGIGIKKYAQEGIKEGDIIIGFDQHPCIYDPNTATFSDNYKAGSTSEYTMKLGLPTLQLAGGTTNYRMRKIISNFKRISTGLIQYIFYDQDTGTSSSVVDNNTDEGIKRLGATRDITTKSYVEISGRFEVIEAIRFIVRPVIRGLR